MSTVTEVTPPAQAETSGTEAGRAAIINDFSIVACTKNGSGSQTANLTILRSFFKMGIPVVGKNLFPSNIQGRPTWYTIRASKDGYVARTDAAEITISLNPEGAQDDYNKTAPGGVFIYSETGDRDSVKVDMHRKDLSHYPLPVKKIADPLEKDAKLRTYGRNMAYVGALSWLIGIDRAVIEAALRYHFKGKDKPVQSNMAIVNAAYNWVSQNWTKTDPFQVEKMNATEGLIVLDGNTAGALGAIYGGVNFVAWYPITPATSLADALGDYLPILRKSPDGKPTYSVIQSEDELAAAGMIIGAGWAGARSMTSTSGPGISLMSEFTGYAYFAEIPCVIWDVTRMGPSTGLPTRVSQGDVLKAYYLGHGDTKNICLLPSSVYECFEMGWKAQDVAEKFQTPVFVLSDLDIGMNNWMSKPFDYPETPLERGKVLTEADLERLKGFARYRDVDGDGIGYRTLPGNKHPFSAYFTRGSGHNENASLTEKSPEWVANMNRLSRKFESARTHLAEICAPVVDEVEGAEIAIISFGSTDPAIAEARSRLTKEGYKISYLRIKALPLANEIKDFVAKHKHVHVIEMNHDAQMLQLLRLHMPDMATKLHACNLCDGLPLTAKWVSQAILSK